MIPAAGLKHRALKQAVALLLLFGVLRGQAYPQLPQLPLKEWSFAAELADGSVQVLYFQKKRTAETAAYALEVLTVVLLQVVWHNVAGTGQTWQVQKAADSSFASPAVVSGALSNLCSSCVDQLTLTEAASSGRRSAHLPCKPTCTDA